MEPTKSPLIPRRALLGAALASCWPLAAHGQASAARRYAVLSEMAHAVSVVHILPAVGDKPESVQVDRLPIADGALDKAACVMARESLQRAQPQANVWLIAPLTEALFPGFDNPFVGARLALPADLADALRQRGSTHLVLLSAQRAAAQFQLEGTSLGSGSVSGLGFYLDNNVEVRARDTGVSALGFIAAFASFRVSIIEAASARLVASKAVFRHRVQTVLATGDAAMRNAWQAMSEERKANTMRVLMEQGIDEPMRELLAAG